MIYALQYVFKRGIIDVQIELREKIMKNQSPSALPMSYIESAFMRWHHGNDITQVWCSSLTNFVLNLRKYYEHDQCVVLYADVSDFWYNAKLSIKLV